MKCVRCKTWPCECADGITLVRGDCRRVLPALGDTLFDAVLTDPPYGHNNNSDDLIFRREKALSRPLKDGESAVARPIRNDGPEANSLVRRLSPTAHHEARPWPSVKSSFV